MPKQLIIAGLPKSGTSFLRNLLNAHPLIHLQMEHLNRLLRIHPLESDVLLGERYERVLARNRKENPGAAYVGDKVLYDDTVRKKGLLPFLEEKSKVIVICRDPRDRLVSMRYHAENRERQRANWIFYPHWQPMPDEMEWWQKALGDLISAGALKIRYEDLYCHPEHEMKKILAFLGLNVTDKQIRTMIRSARDVRLHFRINPFRRGKPGEWKKRLFPDECLKISEKLGGILADNDWEKLPGWEYEGLKSLQGHYLCRGLFARFPGLRTPEFWTWIRDHRSRQKWIDQWFGKRQSYEDAWMRVENFQVRLLPIPLWAQRPVAGLFTTLRQKRLTAQK